MILYSDKFTLEIWNRIYPVGHPWHDTHGGRIVDKQHRSKQEIKDEVLAHLDDEECTGMHISREEQK